jgi:ferredoxin
MGHEACSGCDLCLLACPVWHSTRDVRLTPHGRAKALQGGATIRDIAPALDACTLCGSCEPACPEAIPLTDLVREMRGKLRFNVHVERPSDWRYSVRPVDADVALIPDAALARNPAAFERVVESLGNVAMIGDAGADISRAIEAGAFVASERRERFLAQLRNVKTIVTGDGLLFRALRGWLPRARVRSLGETLSAVPALRRSLRGDDLYVIEPRAFHADHARLVRYYDAMRHSTGCAMNLDLQRLALGTMAGCLPTRRGGGVVDPKAQARWILEGRSCSRIVLEDLADAPAFEAVTDVPVLHVAELT